MPGVALMILVMGGSLIFLALQKGTSAPQVVNATAARQPLPQTQFPAAEPPPQTSVADAPAAKPPTAAPAAFGSRPPSPPPNTPTHSEASQPSAPATPPLPAAASVAPADSSTAANADTTAIAPPDPAKPATPKLQGIFYNPSRPSAVVNGRSVSIGSTVGEFRVLAITPEFVTISSGSQTNVLSLEP